MAGAIGCRLVAIHHPHHHRHATLVPTPFPEFNIKLPTIHSRRHSTMSATATTPTTAVDNLIVQKNPTTSGCWSEFAGKVSGEWDGYGADFGIDGKPIELPENVVPNAYKEWEVRVFDWQTQCPTLAQPDNTSVMYKLIKLLPTVGCEADAATRFTVDQRFIGGADNMVSSFAYQSSGCYIAVWSTQKSRKVLELEHCLIDPRDKESRVRVIQIVDIEGNQKLVLKNITVFVEQWYGPFTNGEQLGGCSIRDSAFATTQVLNGSEVSRVWQRSNSKATFQDSANILQVLVPVDGIEKSAREKEGLVLLPKNLWSSMVKIEDGDKTCCEVGWLLEPGRAITSKCVFSRNAELKEIIVSSETAA